ncbi:MAG: hypothetical protein KDB37_15975 [Ilumatobacter sp.]|nr:hypothetical protein [Ilumatobacter sp.]
MSTTAPTSEPVSADELRQKIQAFQNSVQGKVDEKKNTLVTVGGGAVIVLLVLFFLLGKRSGKKKTTLVEIRRL